MGSGVLDQPAAAPGTTATNSSTGLVTASLDCIEPCPIQPRVNVSVDLVARLASSMKAGRHEPLLEVEPLPGARGRYQIVCGEQRWRAAREAGLAQVLVRVHPHLGYLERLEKQYEENRLRADLDPVEEAHCILIDKTIRDIGVAERLLKDSLVPFQALDDKRIRRRSEFVEHLDGLKRLLVKHKIGVDNLSPWSETERALAISESQRKTKVGILRMDTDLQEAVRGLPAEHAIQISRLTGDRQRQVDLIERAHELTHRQVHDAVERLRSNPGLPVVEALRQLPSVPRDENGADGRMTLLADLCRQLLRLISILRAEAGDDALAAAVAALGDLRKAIEELGAPA